jgi:hypothetical protein
VIRVFFDSAPDPFNELIAGRTFYPVAAPLSAPFVLRSGLADSRPPSDGRP